jgi:hypothetical protein
MSRLTSEQQELLSRPRERWDEDYELAERERSRGGVSGWLIAGLALAGLGALAWYYLGPDLRRYMKIRNM